MFLWFPWSKKANNLQNLFHTILATLSVKKKKKKKAVKDMGGVWEGGRFDPGQRFNGFFLPSLSESLRVSNLNI